ncbi:MAG: ComEC/Rec2 family competence protein [Patescibacteria group bacterium]|nr:ComEC/Rec2 family competence protein [Patescibacteria group bacterium]
MFKGIDIHRVAFWFCSFFIVGVGLATMFGNIYFLIVLFFWVSAFFFLLNKNFFALLILLSGLLGVFYFRSYSLIQAGSVIMPFGADHEFTGIIKNVSKTDSAQTLIVDLKGGYSGLVSIGAKAYPAFEYGDLIKFNGIINKPEDVYKNFYLLHGISGQVNFPEIELMTKGEGNPIKAWLFNLREKIKDIFKRSLPKEKAAFLTGITIGGKEDFSKELKNEMALSGTTHLVAISGYNISIIVLVVGAFFASIFSATASFYLTILTVILFVIMTGAEASVVRAAVMGVIVLFAERTERLYDPRNAIVLTAFIMILLNPFTLIFDAGFQLSFAALIGIIYLAPAIKSLFSNRGRSHLVKENFDKGFLSWRENAVVTASAQIMAFPILIYNFGIFSLSSLFANILILEFVPITMGVGFFMAGAGWFSIFSAKMLGIIANMFISYDFFIMDIFSKFSFILPVKGIGFLSGIAYYVAVSLFVYKFKKNEKESRSF